MWALEDAGQESRELVKDPVLMNTGSTQPPDNLLEGHFSLSSIRVPKAGFTVSTPHLTMGVKGSDRQ